MPSSAWDWRNYLSCAEHLASSSAEADHRSAISRAYYAAFHVACEYLAAVQNVPLPKTAQKHSDCRAALTKLGGRTLEASRTLATMSISRNSADYDKVFGGNAKKKAMETVILARQVITVLDEL